MLKIPHVKRKSPSKRPMINEKRPSNPNLSGMTVEQEKEIANLIDSKAKRVGIQKKKSSIASNKTKFQYPKGK